MINQARIFIFTFFLFLIDMKEPEHLFILAIERPKKIMTQHLKESLFLIISAIFQATNQKLKKSRFTFLPNKKATIKNVKMNRFQKIVSFYRKQPLEERFIEI